MSDQSSGVGGRRPRVFTDDVKRMIPEWLRLGADRHDIAEALGTTPGSLSAWCSQNGISLNPLAYTGRGGNLSECMRQGLDTGSWNRLQCEARRRHVPVAKLVIDLISAITDDDLFKAVIDEDAA